MSNIEDTVEALEKNLTILLQRQQQLLEINLKLKKQLQQYHQKVEEQEKALQSCSEKNESLKIANSMLGSDENKRETKLKINALIRDIDHCIGQLSK